MDLRPLQGGGDLFPLMRGEGICRHRPSPRWGGEAVLETTSEAMWLFCLRVNPVRTEIDVVHAPQWCKGNVTF